MTSRKHTIVWTRMTERSFNAHYGGLHIGGVGYREDGSAFWSIDAVHMRWIAKGHDLHASSLDNAVRALERAWQKWLDHSGLVLPEGRTTEPHKMWGERLHGRPSLKKT